MDDVEMKILKAIFELSPKSFVSPVKVNEILQMDEVVLGNRLKLMKKSGHVDIMTSEYPTSLALPNSISKVYITELGRESLKKGG